MAKESPSPLHGAARDRYMKRLEARLEFLHDFISGKEDGWGLEGRELQHAADELSRVWTIVRKSEIKQVADRRQQDAHAGEAIAHGDNIIPFRPRA